MILVIRTVTNTIRALHPAEEQDVVCTLPEYMADKIMYRAPAQGQMPVMVGDPVPADAIAVRMANAVYTPKSVFRCIENQYQTDAAGLVTILIDPPFKNIPVTMVTTYETAEGRPTIPNIVSEEVGKVVIRVKRSTPLTVVLGSLLDVLGLTATAGLKVNVRIKGT